MATITLTEEKLSDLMDKVAHKAAEDTIAGLFSNETSLNHFLELAEDFAFGKILESSPTGKTISGDEFLKQLDKQIAGLK